MERELLGYLEVPIGNPHPHLAGPGRLPVRLPRRRCALAADFGSEVHISPDQLATSSASPAKASTVNRSSGARTAFWDLQRGRILLQNMAKLTAVPRNE